jgi:hypothetical protein
LEHQKFNTSLAEPVALCDVGAATLIHTQLHSCARPNSICDLIDYYYIFDLILCVNNLSFFVLACPVHNVFWKWTVLCGIILYSFFIWTYRYVKFCMVWKVLYGMWYIYGMVCYGINKLYLTLSKPTRNSIFCIYFQFSQ